MFPAPGIEMYPWLVYPHGRHTGKLSLCRISSSGPVCCENVNIPHLNKKMVLYCSDDGEWLLLFYHTEINDHGGAWRFSIWCTTSGESIVLPPCERPEGVLFNSIDRVQALISSCPYDPACLILLFFQDRPFVYSCRVGDKKWRKFDHENCVGGEESFPPLCESQLHRHTCDQLRQPVSLDGKVFALHSCRNNLVRIDVDESNHCLFTVMRNSEHVLCGTFRSFLVPCGDQELYLVVIILPVTLDFRCREAPKIQVQKFDCQADRWEMVTSLNGGSIFLGNGYSFSVQNKSKDGDNKWSFIHFTSAQSEMLFSYRMEDERITSYAPCPNNPPGLWHSYWIMPAQPEQPLDLASKQVDDDGGGGDDGDEDEGGAEQVDGDGDSMMHCSKKQKKEPVGITLSDLSPELIGLIAENLSSVVDYVNCLRLNRIGKDIVTNRKKPFQACLMFRDQVNGAYHITDCSLNRKLSVKIPEALRNSNIGCSRDGWILLGDQSTYSLFNPLSLRTNKPENYRVPNNGCGVMNLTYVGEPWKEIGKNGSVFAMYVTPHLEEAPLAFKLGNKNLLPLILRNFSPSCNSPVLVKECLFYLGADGRLGRVECEKLEWKVERTNSIATSLLCRRYLVECGGELVLVCVHNGMDMNTRDTWFQVFKLNHDHPKRKWEEINCLDGYCLYVGWPTSLSCLAETPEMADRIYFPRFYREGLVYYSLKTEKFYSVWNDKEELRSFHGTTMFSESVWFQPDWR